MAWLEVVPTSAGRVCWRLWRRGRLLREGYATSEADAQAQIRAMLPPEPEPDRSADVDLLVPEWLRATNMEVETDEREDGLHS